MALLSPNAKWVFPTKYHLKEACLLRHVNLRAALNSPIGERNLWGTFPLFFHLDFETQKPK